MLESPVPGLFDKPADTAEVHRNSQAEAIPDVSGEVDKNSNYAVGLKLQPEPESPVAANSQTGGRASALRTRIHS